MMVAQLFTKHGLNARVMDIDEASTHQGDPTGLSLICLSFIEPLSTVHLRLAIMQARRRAPHAEVMLCIWQQRDRQLVDDLVKRVRADAIVTTMADALEHVIESSNYSRP